MDITSFRLRNLFSSKKNWVDLSSYIRETPFWIRLSFLSFILLLAWLLICYMAFSKHVALQSFAQELSILEAQAKYLERRKEAHQRLKEIVYYASSDYLAQVVEPMPLLQEERERITSLIKQFPDNTSLKERLLFFNTDQNQIRFEKGSNNSSHYKEYHLSHPVQMDLNNLKKFLEAIEEDRYDAPERKLKEKPFFLVKKFDLHKSYEKGDEKVYSINVELLQKI